MNAPPVGQCSVVWHSSSLEHLTGIGHPESPQRLEAIFGELRKHEYTSLINWIESAEAPFTAIAAVHDLEHLTNIQRIAASGGGAVDGDTIVSAGSWRAALHAAGAAIKVAELAMKGVPAFAVIRPPGHHATASQAMGFCLLNNVAVAARYALDELGATRVLIIDWDVHHGNGTQDIFERDERVKYVSLHQWPLYPGTGAADETGVGNIFNVPLPPGLPREEYVSVLNDAVDNAARAWRPDLVLISAGYDAMAGDPLAGFTLEPEDYASWVAKWKGLDAPIGVVLEGGYAPERIALASAATVRSLVSNLRS